MKTAAVKTRLSSGRKEEEEEEEEAKLVPIPLAEYLIIEPALLYPKSVETLSSDRLD